MTKPAHSRRQIFGIPALLALVTLAALIIGLIGDDSWWPLVWIGTLTPIAVAVVCLRKRGE